MGAPRVDVAALVELERLLIGTANPAHSRNDIAIVREEGNEVCEIAGGAPSRQMNFLFGNSRLEGVASAERDKIISALVQILMQAAGLSVEELEDDQS